MRIKSVACEQFAGLIDKELEFDNGLNIILGDNESGKSTMVDLIYHMLFQDSKIDARRDTAFLDNYFPKKVSGPSGDVIDGEIKLETNDGRYKLTKEWDKKDGSCRLRTPDGTVIKSEEQIKAIMREVLGYGQGIYGEIVFPSQKRSQNVIESIMKELSKKKADKLDELKGELAASLNQATLETGGIALDKLENELKNIINIYGERWDFDMDAPEGGLKRGIGNPWSSAYTKAADEGKQSVILRSFYDMKNIEKAQADTLVAEKNVEDCKKNLLQAQNAKKIAQEEKEKFSSYVSVLGHINMVKEKLADLEDKLKEQEIALQDWPKFKETLCCAKELKDKLEQAKVRELYLKVSELQKSVDEKNKELNTLKPVEQDDIKSLKVFIKQVSMLEGQISGLNLVAKVKKLGDTPINITSATTGKKLTLIGDELVINEAVEINIPDVVELQLMPKGVDIDDIKAKLEKARNEIFVLYKKYGVDSVEALEENADKSQRLHSEIEVLNQRLNVVLGDMTWDKLCDDNSQLPEIVPTEIEVKKQIVEACGSKNLQDSISYYSNKLEEYTKKYVSTENLSLLVKSTNDELDKINNKLNSFENVPVEYADITDLDEYGKQLKLIWEELEQKCETLSQNLKDAEIALADRTSEEYEDALIQANTNFENAKETYAHWCNIYDVFLRLKESSRGNSTGDIEDKFKEYLDIISDGKLSLVDIDDKLNVKLASDNHAMTYDILSEGTKDTVSLVFRLAMLEHIFPDGGGFAVFDDPFTDMDPKRVAQACKLIEKFAENNQVIFVTCDEKYLGIMDGNVLKTP